MAMTGTLAAGADARYPFGGMAGGEAGKDGRPGTEYYLSATEKGGEPPGVWRSEGLADLGIRQGQAITKADEEMFAKIYGQFQDTRDPSGETTLGRPPREATQLEKIYEAKLAAEPEATAERQAELRSQARAETPLATVYFWDNTLSVDKSITLAHASALAAAQEARADGDAQSAQLWESRAAGIWEEIESAVEVYLDTQQQESGYVRTGHHGARVGDTDAGRFERAEAIPVASFSQHVSRAGDPHLHVHNLMLNRVKSQGDGQWRALDSRALHRHAQEATAKAAFSLESALTRRFGFEWAYREESKGRILKGFDEKYIKEFSSRREQVTRNLDELRREYREIYGREPDQRQLATMNKAAYYENRPSKDESRDLATRLRDWTEQSRNAELGSLRDLATQIWGHLDGAQDGTRDDAQPGRQLTAEEERRAMAAGLAQAQQERSVWSRSELVRSIAQHLPDHAAAASTADAVKLLDDLADRALRGESGEAIRRLDAPEWPRVPDSLRREDGESVYTVHGSARYATAGQLSMEQRILDRSQERTANRVDPQTAAWLLGTAQEKLEAQLRDAQAARDPQARTSTGLRIDQATAAFLALTSDRRVEAIVAGAGTGKTYTAEAIASAWEEAGRGKVLGLNMTSAGRNVHTEAGFKWALNTSQYLGHLPDQREARGSVPLGEKAMVVIDEATQVSMPDIDAVLRNAGLEDAKVVVILDPEQLPAVEAGGGFEMLTRQLGYAQLTEAERFTEAWERDASLQLREGDKSALAEYDAHGRLHGGTFDDMAERAVQNYLADHLEGKSVIQTTQTHAERDELNRRAQEYLTRWGKVDVSKAVPIMDGRTAHLGDLLLARQNDNARQAGEEGRTLANSDLMRVVDVGDRHVTVVRQTGTDKETGGRTWSEPYQVPNTYLARHGTLGYAQTGHNSMGSTVTRGIAFGSEKTPRSALYVEMTRGRESDHGYFYLSASFASGKWAQGQGHKPAPELERFDKLEAEREGAEPGRRPDEHDPIAIMAKSLGTDARQLSATEYQARAMGNADHLGLLGHIWREQVREESGDRFTAALREALGPDLAADALKDTDDLYRALRAAELAGKDGPAVLRAAIEQRDVTGAASVSAVLAFRVREMTEHLPPAHKDSWAGPVPQTGDPDKDRFLRELAEGINARPERIGEHAAEHPPLWATQALGDVPDDPEKRADWQERAGVIGAYREMWSYDHEGHAIGPEPNTTNPEARADWHKALGAMTKVDGIDVRGLTDGALFLRRDAYERETSWAPKYVGDELRLARLAGHNSRIDESMHRHEAEAAGKDGDQDKAEMHRQVAGSFAALQRLAGTETSRLERIHETRQAWEKLTEDTRRLAQASDVELHRRGILGPDDKLRSAEPERIKYPEPSAEDKAKDDKQPPTRTETEERQSRALGLTRDGQPDPDVRAQLAAAAEQAREQQARIDELLSLREPAEDPDEIDLGRAWGSMADEQRDAIIQPPRPEIKPAESVIEAANERDMEAGD